jgi:hypothetical protein
VRPSQFRAPLATTPALRSRRFAPLFGALYYDGVPAIGDPAPWEEPDTADASATPVPVVRSAYSGPSSIQPPADSSGATVHASSSATGTVRLDIEPRAAQVYVDGFYTGTVDALNARGGLTASAGWHRLEFRAPGYQTPAANVTIEARRTIVLRLALQPIP